jgi:hypothetical protein
LTAGAGKKFHVAEIDFQFSSPLKPSSAQNAGNYAVTQTVKSGRRLVTQAVAFNVVYVATTNTVRLLLLGNPQFAYGGEVVVKGAAPSGIMGTSGSYLDGGGLGMPGNNGSFTIAPRGAGVTRAG